MVILSHGALTLVHLNRHSILVVLVGAKHLALLGGHKAVTLDECSHHTANGLNTQRKRGDIKENQRLGLLLTAEHTTLNGGTVGNSLIGVNTSRRLLAVEVVLQ
mmetsp:Transcript_15909/g.40756  ORF Transcript_15909/g.40756 Transcript_15909/m.40756 type:complete len:104 (+) Transcript_15909:614-925(+)